MLKTEVERFEDHRVGEAEDEDEPENLDADEDEDVLGFQNHLSVGLFDQGKDHDQGWPKEERKADNGEKWTCYAQEFLHQALG